MSKDACGRDFVLHADGTIGPRTAQHLRLGVFVPKPPAPCGPGWSAHQNIDMCGQGDVEIIHNWRATHSIEDLQRIVEQKGYSAFTVSSGQPSFGHAALKKFPYQLTAGHCKPITTCCNHPCTIYIWSGGRSGSPSGKVAPGGSVTLERVGALTYAASEAHARARGGRLLTLTEARAHMGGRPLCPGDDQWCAVAGRDWVQIGSRHHHAGKSHMQQCGGYPPWGDDANNMTYGRPTWNVYALYTTASVPALERDLSGRWFSFARADGRPNGDRYEFRREGNVYKTYRNGHHNENDHFTFDGATGFHSRGPTFTLQANGDLHWDLEGGKWGSRKEGGGGGYEGQRPNACPVCGDPGRMSPGCPGCNHPGGGGHHHHHHHHPRAPSGYYRTEKYVGGCTIFLCLMGFGPLIFCCPCDERKVWVPT